MTYLDAKKAISVLEMRLYAQLLESVENKENDVITENASYKWFTAKHIYDSLITVSQDSLNQYLIEYLDKVNENLRMAERSIFYKADTVRAFENQFIVINALCEYIINGDDKEYNYLLRW